ncbi:hypothetical protein TNCV_396561 [Trichonephila clavipes]|nr:hypothetical protein TNCV_396561 [Trichonephila clavipes]
MALSGSLPQINLGVQEESGTVIDDDDDTNVDSEKELSLEQKLELAIDKKISTNQNTMQINHLYLKPSEEKLIYLKMKDLEKANNVSFIKSNLSPLIETGLPEKRNKKITQEYHLQHREGGRKLWEQSFVLIRKYSIRLLFPDLFDLFSNGKGKKQQKLSFFQKSKHVSYKVQLKRTLLHHPLAVGEDSLPDSKKLELSENGRGVSNFRLALYKQSVNSHLRDEQQLLRLTLVYQSQCSRSLFQAWIV